MWISLLQYVITILVTVNSLVEPSISPSTTIPVATPTTISTPSPAVIVTPSNEPTPTTEPSTTPSPTPSLTITPTPTMTPSVTPTLTPTLTVTPSPQPTDTPMPTPTPSRTASSLPPSPTLTRIPYINQLPQQNDLDSDLISRNINQKRLIQGLAPFRKDEFLCSLAQSRRPELYNEIFGDEALHAGLERRNIPYWITENEVYAQSEDDALDWWMSSWLHRSAIYGNFIYSCGACLGNACVQLFTNFTPR